MAGLKTQPTRATVTEFINSIEDDRRRRECKELMKIMKEVTGERPRMWGPSIVGYGRYHYRYKTGREGDWFLAGFSPRKQALTVYIMSGFRHHAKLMKQLGKYKVGKSCLYIKTLEDVDKEVLKQLIKESAAYVEKHSIDDRS